MIRGLPVYILEQDIIDTILTHALEPKEVRLIRKKDTGDAAVRHVAHHHAVQPGQGRRREQAHLKGKDARRLEVC